MQTICHADDGITREIDPIGKDSCQVPRHAGRGCDTCTGSLSGGDDRLGAEVQFQERVQEPLAHRDQNAEQTGRRLADHVVVESEILEWSSGVIRNRLPLVALHSIGSHQGGVQKRLQFDRCELSELCLREVKSPMEAGHSFHSPVLRVVSLRARCATLGDHRRVRNGRAWQMTSATRLAAVSDNSG